MNNQYLKSKIDKALKQIEDDYPGISSMPFETTQAAVPLLPLHEEDTIIEAMVEMLIQEYKKISLNNI